MSRAARRALLVAAGLGLAATAWAGLGTFTTKMMTPDAPFDPAIGPPAPDYDQDRFWSALPGRTDAADVAPAALPAGDQTTAPADVFYLHPTSYLGNGWNGPADDPKLNAASDAGGARIQASAFNACCAVYAPYYRQANGTAFTHPSAGGDRALDRAYADVSAAFDAFQRRRGADRPFLVAAHSQGSILAERLLAERISGAPLQHQLVGAWLAGGLVQPTGVGALPACASPTQTGCVNAWNARQPGFETTSLTVVNRHGGPLLCTNPLSWRLDGAPAPAADNLGAVFLDARDAAPRPGFADAQCEGGLLMVRTLGRAPRDLMSRLLDHVLGEGNLHPIEYQLYWGNIRANAATRLEAWMQGP